MYYKVRIIKTIKSDAPTFIPILKLHKGIIPALNNLKFPVG